MNAVGLKSGSWTFVEKNAISGQEGCRLELKELNTLKAFQMN